MIFAYNFYLSGSSLKVQPKLILDMAYNFLPYDLSQHENFLIMWPIVLKSACYKIGQICLQS